MCWTVCAMWMRVVDECAYVYSMAGCALRNALKGKFLRVGRTGFLCLWLCLWVGWFAHMRYAARMALGMCTAEKAEHMRDYVIGHEQQPWCH